MRGVCVLAMAIALALPFGAGASPREGTTYDAAVKAIVATFGFVPGTATVNGREVPSEQVLAFLRETSVPLATDQLPADDVGVGVWQGAVGFDRCAGGVLAHAAAFSTGSPAEGFADEQIQGVEVPGSSYVCPTPFGPLTIRYVLGAATASVAPTAHHWYAAVAPPGQWALGKGTTHSNDFQEVELAGRVGQLNILISYCWWGTCFYQNLEYLFGGVPGPLPGAVSRDAALIAIAS